MSFDQPLALVARVHGYPAQLVVWHLPLHEVPHLLSHHRDWVEVGQEEELACLVNLISSTEELSCGKKWNGSG